MRYTLAMLALYHETIADIARYREVIYQLFVRDLRVRHTHTKLGLLWSLLSPILQLAVLTLVFSQMTRLDVRDYRLFAFSGLLPWLFFQACWLMGAYSFVDNQTLIRKVYLPRVVFPLGRVMVRMIEYLVSLAVLGAVALALGHHLNWSLLTLPAAIVILFFFSLGVAMIAAVVAVYVRDFLHLQTVLVQLVYFTTPIIYPLSALPEKYQAVAGLNPLYVVIRLFHRLVYEGVLPTWSEWLIAAAMGASTLTLGLFAIKKADNDLVLRL